MIYLIFTVRLIYRNKLFYYDIIMNIQPVVSAITKVNIRIYNVDLYKNVYHH